MSSIGKLNATFRIMPTQPVEVFSRLDPRAMSSVADHIESIQHALRNNQQEVSLSKKIILSRNVAIFITMNPTYEGRRRLPENLKSLFRDVSLSSPDVATIAKVC